MLSSVALFQSKSGILSGLRASLVLQAMHSLWVNVQLFHPLAVMVSDEKYVPI